MAQSKILVDSNSYFRLAKSIRPLLSVAFGEENYCLYVLKDLEIEYDRSSRLQSKFEWVNDDEYFDNRKQALTIPRKDKNETQRTIEILENHKYENELGVSPVDINYLAHAYVLDIPVVTDDKDMLELAEDFEIQTLNSLNLLSLMLKCDHINIDKVREIAAYWKFIKDIPGSFKEDYKSLFKENVP